MRRFLKWAAIGLGGLFAVLALVVVGLYLVGRSKLDRKYPTDGQALIATVSDGSADRGEHVLRTHGCQECHGQRLEGRVFLDIPPGRIVAPNLTRGKGGVGARYTSADWDRAIRYGLRRDGEWLLPFMPYPVYNKIGDEDMAALIAYLDGVPPVDNVTPPTKIRLPGYAMVALGFDLDELLPDLQAPRPASPAPGPTAAYGEYLAASTCVECHGDRLQGGKHPAPDAPPAPGLAAAAAWPAGGFARALREGVTPDGRKLTDWMPWKYFAVMTDEEVQALDAYVKALASRSAGRKEAS